MEVKIEASWKRVLEEEFNKDYFVKLTEFVKSEYRNSKVYPRPQFIFKAFETTPFEKVKVIILGQDPYHEPRQANGLCFAVDDGIKNPPSLQNIYKELKSDLGIEGDINSWTGQGVFLLNSTLTVRASSAGSHQNKGWEEFTDAIIKKVDRLDNITKELITFGRPLKFRMKRHNLKRLLSRILSLIKPRCKAQKITVVKDYCDELQDVLIDDGHMEEVFTNIITNALDVMSKGGKLTVRTELDEAQKKAVVRISNTGHGIPKKDMPNLFKPFFTTKKQGTGLGLAISHRIVTEHKGTILVESKARGRDKGTTFIIRLPA